MNRDDLFGTESEDEGESNSKEILPTQLEPPNVGFTEEGTVMPSEFELVDPLELKFKPVKATTPTKDVSLFFPGSTLDIDPMPFDESSPNGFVPNGAVLKRVMRWRRDERGEMESNAKLVEWDDGAMSFYVEGKWFDLGQEKILSGTELLCVDQGVCLQSLHAVESGMVTVAAVTDESDEEAEVITEPAKQIRKPKTKRVTVLGNPVKDQEAKLKRIEQERKDREIMERKRKNLQEKYRLPELREFDGADEANYGPDKGAKRTRPSRKQPARKKKQRSEEYEEDFVEEGEDVEIDQEEEEAEADFESDESKESEVREEAEAQDISPVPNTASESEQEEGYQRRMVVMPEEDEDSSEDS